MNEKLKAILFRLKIFGWYFLTEPIRQSKELIMYGIKIISSFNKTYTWIYILVGFSAYSLFIGNRKAASYMLITILFLLFYWEWERGLFMKVWRDHNLARIKKQEQKDKEEGIEYPK